MAKLPTFQLLVLEDMYLDGQWYCSGDYVVRPDQKRMWWGTREGAERYLQRKHVPDGLVRVIQWHG